jgi:hypothetical protein
MATDCRGLLSPSVDHTAAGRRSIDATTLRPCTHKARSHTRDSGEPNEGEVVGGQLVVCAVGLATDGGGRRWSRAAADLPLLSSG